MLGNFLGDSEGREPPQSALDHVIFNSAILAEAGVDHQTVVANVAGGLRIDHCISPSSPPLVARDLTRVKGDFGIPIILNEQSELSPFLIAFIIGDLLRAIGEWL